MTHRNDIYYDTDAYHDEIYEDYEEDIGRIGSVQPYYPDEPVLYDTDQAHGEYHSFVEEYEGDYDEDVHEYNPVPVRTQFTQKADRVGYMSRMESVPFHSGTTHQDHFVWKDPIQKKRKETPAERVQLPFYDETTNKADFHKKIPLPTTNYKPQPMERSDIPFYGETSNQADYGHKQPVKTKSFKKNSSVGNPLIPFEGETTHQAAFVPKQTTKQKSLRVASAGLFGHEKDFRTINQQSYTYKTRTMCPAEILLNAGKSRARLVNGHFFVRKGAKQK